MTRAPTAITFHWNLTTALLLIILSAGPAPNAQAGQGCTGLPVMLSLEAGVLDTEHAGLLKNAVTSWAQEVGCDSVIVTRLTDKNIRDESQALILALNSEGVGHALVTSFEFGISDISLRPSPGTPKRYSGRLKIRVVDASRGAVVWGRTYSLTQLGRDDADSMAKLIGRLLGDARKALEGVKW